MSISQARAFCVRVRELRRVLVSFSGCDQRAIEATASEIDKQIQQPPEQVLAYLPWYC